MKKLLVPTDFSANATNAVEYAVEIANGFGSQVTLLHTYRLYRSTGMLLSVEEYVRQEAEAEMSKLMARMEGRLAEGVELKARIIQGDPVQVTSLLAENEGYDLIIMGTQGATGLKEIFIGSTTNGVIRSTVKPVLAIPGRFAGRPPLKVIVLAMDENTISFAGVFTPLTQLARVFDAKVRVYHKDTGDGDAGVDPTVDMFLEGVDHSFHYELDAEDVNESINQFVEDYQGDLLCMVRRQRGFFNGLFHVSTTKKEAFDSPVPLLVLHDQAD